ncbi:MAG: hypothetical protein F6K36_25165 [Symploca sp. SIO3C6]|nr:hypothetical protein [Symploca sp. SIO3C6]NET03258.1 hypothetical protein [Symploca sp. SIO2B6]NET52677.1 hypothetical protein [Merismopedia sp. SIO2A8]
MFAKILDSLGITGKEMGRWGDGGMGRQIERGFDPKQFYAPQVTVGYLTHIINFDKLSN